MRVAALVATGAMIGAQGCAESDGASGLGDVGVVGGAIAGGYNTDGDTAVVGIVSFGGGGLGICSGSLIAPNLVLTAQHCVAPILNSVQGGVSCQQTRFGDAFDAGNMFITTRSRLSNSPSIYRAVREIIIPDDGSSRVCGRDIALMVLAEAVPASEAVPLTVRVDSPLISGTSWQYSNGEEYSAIGFGNTSDFGDDSGQRRRRDNLNVTCVHDACPSWAVDPAEWLGDTGICSGDSGGPAVDTYGRVVGVVSRGGADCSSPVYGSVNAWGDWISETATYAAQLGGYEAPRWAVGWPTDPAYYAPVGGGCSSNGDCGAGFCVDGACTRACTELATCPGGYSCDGGRCALAPIGQACGEDAGCASGTCRDGQCTRPCEDAATDCPAGYVCDGTCKPEAIGQACDAAEQCEGGICRDGLCSRACGAEAPCGVGYTCDADGCGLMPVGDACASFEDCAAGSCRDGYCTRGCDAAAPCPNGYTCGGDGECALIPVGGACADDTVCGAGFCGADGLCTRGCDALADCPAGFQCDGGACLLASVGNACEADDACVGGFCDGGACTRACSEVATCPDGYHCDGDGACAKTPSSGCGAAPGSGAPLAWLFAFVGLALPRYPRRRQMSVR